jgi:4a-hydroxytetrahydrobiopterin dehydratase
MHASISEPARSGRAWHSWTRSEDWPTRAGHHPDVDLRSDSVTVRLRTNDGTLGEREVALARQISAAARGLGVPVDPSSLQIVQIAIDALVIPDVLPFWRAVLGYRQIDDEDVIDPLFQGPPIWFQQMDAPRPQRNRIHIDVYVPHDQAEARVAAALAAGGHIVNDEHAPGWWTLADPEGNEVDVAPGRTATDPSPRSS